MSSSAITTQIAQLKAGNIQNQADSTSIYSSGQWSFKNSTAVASVTISDAGNVSVPGTTQISWPVDGGTSRGLVTIGAQGTTGGSLFVNTPSLSVGYASGLAVDGSYSSFISTVNIKALGVSSAGGYGSVLAFHTSSGTSSAERMRIDASGNLLVGTGSSPGYHTLVKNHNDWATSIQNSHASSPFGLLVRFTGSSPNNGSNHFLLCLDSTTTRMNVYANGGIANYQGNNINYSDRRAKKDFAPAKSYLDTICKIPVQTFKYIDQIDEEKTLGVIAQDVQAVAPELVSEDNWGTEEEPKLRLAIYQTDLQYALMKCIQELSAKNEALEARLAALESK